MARLSAPLCLLFTLLSLRSFVIAGLGLPEKIYGVNLGSWLVIEPWMMPQEWVDMGGERCDKCSDCIASEFAFVENYGDRANGLFQKHWDTWFTKDDVNKLKGLGINLVRIPLGYWLIEDLVDRKTEHFPRGGLKALRRGLEDLKGSGISVVLDHHALPGQQAAQQQFSGRCVDEPQFYTPENYHRALVWTAVMTALSHIDPAFSEVNVLQAVNEPLSNASNTPGYGEFQKNFVRVVRTVEFGMGIIPHNEKELKVDASAEAKVGENSANCTAALSVAASSTQIDGAVEVARAVTDAIPILFKLGLDLAIDNIKGGKPFKTRKESLITMFMDKSWQWAGEAPNPAEAAIGAQLYDNHLYYSFGGVADPNEDAYMRSICNLKRVESAAADGNSPLVFGEWALPTQFNATDAFLMRWADAQKMAYSKGAGWIFWNFKIEDSEAARTPWNFPREWSYYEGVERGYLSSNPAEIHNSSVCDPYYTTEEVPAQAILGYKNRDLITNMKVQQIVKVASNTNSFKTANFTA